MLSEDEKKAINYSPYGDRYPLNNKKKWVNDLCWWYIIRLNPSRIGWKNVIKLYKNGQKNVKILVKVVNKMWKEGARWMNFK